MQKRTMILAALTVTATLAGFVVAGTALGADWQEYEGRLAAGNAYVVPVPSGADSLAFAIVPKGDAPFAQIVVFGPQDERVGAFTLGSDTESAEIPDPVAGGFVVFVYDLRDATLSARLQASKAGDLSVVKAEVVRADRPIVKDVQGGKVAKDVSVAVGMEPVFASLLYQGSVENLNAVVESPEGVVLEITGESGVSYAPGLGVGGSAARVSHPENLATGQYRVKVTADELDGTLYLTTLGYKRPAMDAPEKEHDAHAHPAKPHRAPKAPAEPRELPASEAVGAMVRQGVPTLVSVDQPTLLVALPSYFVLPCEEEEDEEDGGDAATDGGPSAHGGKGGKGEKDESTCAEAEADHESDWNGFTPFGYDRHYESEFVVLTVLDGADQLVGVYVLSSDEPVVELKDLASGEYVLFAHGPAREDDSGVVQVAYPDQLMAAIPSREVAIVEKVEEVPTVDSSTVVFETPPLMIALATSDDTLSVDYRATVESPAGTAFESRAIVRAPFLWSMDHYQGVDLTALVAGEYAIQVDALVYEGTLQLHSMGYDRSLEFGAEETKVEADDDDGEAPTAFTPPAALSQVVARLG